MSGGHDTAATFKRAGDGVDDRRAKRRKTALACNECRERKRKCDGVRPVCGACIKKSLHTECVFDTEKTVKSKDSEYVISLQNKVRELEGMLAAQKIPTLSTRDNDEVINHTRSSTVLSQANALESFDATGFRLSEDLPPQRLESSPNNVDILMASTLGTPTESIPLGSNRPDIIGPVRPINNRMNDQASALVHTSPRNTQPYAAGALSPINLGLSFDMPQARDDNLHNPDFKANAGHLESEDDEQSDTGVDPMGMLPTTKTLSNSPEGMFTTNKGYFVGPSSTLGFMKHVQDSVRPRGSHLPGAREPGASLHSRVYPRAVEKERFPAFSRGEYVVPPRHMADALLASYWIHVHVLYPYLHRAAFDNHYRDLWSAANDDPALPDIALENGVPEEDPYHNEPIFFCILNLVLALGCQYDQSIAPEERCDTGDIFFNRAQKFVNFNSLDHGDCALVQALLLMGLYLQSTDKTEKCWNVIGLAIRVGQSVGLYLRPASDQYDARGVLMNQTEHEIRRRLWAGCVLQDRVVSMMSGRPLMLSSMSTRKLNLPCIIDDEEMTKWPQAPGEQPQHKPSYIAFFFYAIKLIQIAGEILEAIYGDSGGSELDGTWNRRPHYDEHNSPSRLVQKAREGDFGDILRLDTALTRWHNELPAMLKITSHATEATADCVDGNQRPEISDRLRAVFARQAKVLEVRFLHAKILLSRPVLTVLLSNVGPTARKFTTADSIHVILQQSMMQQISRHCVLAARNLTTLVYENIVAGDPALPAWWYNVFYLYTAATIFVAERLCPMEQQDSLTLWEEYWKKCLQGLRNYRSQSRSARKCYKVLELIDKRAFWSKENGDPLTSNVLLRDAATTAPLHTNLQTADAVVLPQSLHSLAEQRDQFFDMGETSYYNVLDAQDMAWLEHVPFDTNIEIDYPNAGYLVDDTFLPA